MGIKTAFFHSCARFSQALKRSFPVGPILAWGFSDHLKFGGELELALFAPLGGNPPSKPFPIGARILGVRLRKFSEIVLSLLALLDRRSMTYRREQRVAESPDLHSVSIIEDAKHFGKKLFANGAKEDADPDFDRAKSSRRVGKGRSKRDSPKSKRRRATKRVSACPPKTPRHFDADDDDGEAEVAASAVNGQRDEKESPSKKRNAEILTPEAKSLVNASGAGAKRSILLSDSCNGMRSNRRILEVSDSPGLGPPRNLPKLGATSDESSLQERIN